MTPGDPPDPDVTPGGDEPGVPPSGASPPRLTDTVEIHQLLVSSVLDYAIFGLSPTGHILTWNSGAERLKGYAPDEIIGKHFSIFYPPAAIESEFPQYELRVAAAEGRFEDEGWRLRKGGSRFWANVVITALRDETGTLVGYAKVTRDLTERREAELRAIEDARRVAEAEAANRTKSEFLAAMSHELRTPLNAIGGYIDVLAYGVHGPLTDAQRDALERVRSSQRHLLALISDLLNFSRIEAGRITYDLADVSLPDVIESVRPMVEPQAAAGGIDLEWPRAVEPVIATADHARVGQILLNLVSNAIKFTPSGGTIAVRSFVTEGEAALEVEDTGTGIPADQLEAIFEPFTQVGRSFTSTHEGIGLGLAISRDLARAMDGDLTVRSERGAGSTFRLTLPRSSAADRG